MLILLDIDGVMVPASSWKRPEFLNDGFPVFSMKSVPALQKIISATNATIILTTSHRFTYSIIEWHAIFKLREISVHKIDRLTAHHKDSNRKDEILNWYGADHSLKENFVIIDDDKSLNALPKDIKKNLVLTSPLVGLTDELAEHAVSILLDL